MSLPWNTLDSFTTAEGRVELRQRGARDFLITVGPQVLMNSTAHRSEAALGRLACTHLHDHPGPRVLIGGLGMGYTLRAVLDTLPASGRAVVAELNPVIVEWCRAPLAALTDCAVADSRVTVEIGDVTDVIRRPSSRSEPFDAIVFDLYTGPDAGSHKRDDPLYGSVAINHARMALKPKGMFAVWGEKYDAGFRTAPAKSRLFVSPVSARAGAGCATWYIWHA